MANMRKFSDMRAIGHLCKHYERTVEKGHYSNEDIDEDRLDEDKVNLAPDRGKQTDYIKQKIEEIQNGKTMRKDAVRMCCWVVDAPANLPAEKKAEFFQTAYDFMIDRYGAKSGMGEDICISAYIHNSETTSHLHFAFLPVVERDGQKAFCAKEAVGRADLKTFHQDLAQVMEEKKICKKTDILNGATKRDANGRALSVKELKKERDRERERVVDRWAQESQLNIERNRW